MFIRTIQFALCFMLLTVGIAQADLNAYIRDLNISAQGDVGGYKAKLEARFGTSNSQLEVVFRSVKSPADVAIVLRLYNPKEGLTQSHKERREKASNLVEKTQS